MHYNVFNMRREAWSSARVLRPMIPKRRGLVVTGAGSGPTFEHFIKEKDTQLTGGKHKRKKEKTGER